MTTSSSQGFTASGISSSASAQKDRLNPETNLIRIGKLDNSASMQRAIDRVSRERTVKKNDPPSVVQRKPKVAVSSTGTASATTTTTTTTTTTDTTSSHPTSTARGSSVGQHASSSSSTRSLTGSTRSKEKDVSTKLSSRNVKNSSLKNVTKSNSTTTASSKKTMARVENETSTVVKSIHKGNVLDTVQEEAMGVSSNRTSMNNKQKNQKNNDNMKDDFEEQDDNSTVVSKKDEEKPTKVQDVTKVDSGKDTTAISHDRTTLVVDTPVSDSTAEDIQDNGHTDEGRDARDITRKLITDILRDGNDELSFEFQGFDVPVTYSAAVTYDMAAMALESTAFRQWQDKMSRMVGPKRLEIRHVDIHSVDFVDERVDMIKLNTTCALIDEELQTEQEVHSGVCYLRDNYVALLIELFCVDDESSWAVLVDKPIVPIGSVTALELPVGKVDEDDERLLGFEMEEVEEAFGLELNMFDMINLSKEAYGHTAVHNDMGMCPSPGLSGEHVKIMYLKKEISRDHLLLMRKKFSKQREDGALVSLRVIPLQDMWKVSVDMKVMCALFLLQKANHATLQKGTTSAVHENDHFDDDMSVFSVKGRRLVSNVISSVYKGALLPSKSMEM